MINSSGGGIESVEAVVGSKLITTERLEITEASRSGAFFCVIMGEVTS